MTAADKKWTVVQVFGDAMEGHRCCSCCDGYCGLADSPPTPGPDMLVSLDDGAYISDRYAAIRGDLMAPIEGREPVTGPKVPADWDIPDKRPAPSAALFQPSRVARLTALGVTIHQGEPTDRTPMDRQHLYLGDEHIGWLMPNRDGLTLDKIADLVRTLDAIPEYPSVDGGPRNKAAAIIHDLGGPRIDALWMMRQAAAEVPA